METRAHHILIGSFTVIVAAGAMFFLLWMARSGPGADTDVYDIVSREPVTGLSIGSRVLYSGIHVGTVQWMRIDPKDPRQVIVRIGVLDTTPVRRDTRAELILANITGAVEIQLSGGSPESPPLVRAPDGGVPRITAEPSPIARLRDTSEELIERVSALIENVTRLISEDNVALITRTIGNVNEVSGVLADQSEEIRRGVQGIAQASEETGELLRRVRGMIDSDGEAMMTNATQAMASLQGAAGRLEQLLDENGGAIAGGMQGLNHFGPAIEELRTTLATLRDVARQFDQDPGGYLFGREQVREFRP